MSADEPPLSWHEAAVLISNHQAAYGEGLPNPAARGLCGRSVFDDPTLFPEAPHKTYTWCWTHGLVRGRHDCTTTKED